MTDQSIYSRWEDEEEEELETLPPSQCTLCSRLYRDGTSAWPECKAFPDGIPLEIWTNRVMHQRSYPGDGGITFKPE